MKQKYPIYCCQSCGEIIGLIGRFMFPFFHKCGKEERKRISKETKLIDALGVLEKLGIEITKNLYCTDKLILEMKSKRAWIDKVYKEDGSLGLLAIDSDFSAFLDEKKIPKGILKKKPKGFEGMIFGYNIIGGKRK